MYAAPMFVPFGKYYGKSLATMVIKHPDFVLWLRKQSAGSEMVALLANEASRLISVFDSKPILGNCYGHHCGQAATRCTAFRSHAMLYLWCDTCDP